MGLSTSFRVSAVLSVVLAGGVFCLGGASAAEGALDDPRSSEIDGRLADDAMRLVDPSAPLGTCAEQPASAEIKVTIANVRNDSGNLRLSLYGDQPEEWLKKGMKLVRYDIPAIAGEMTVCMVLPQGEGTYGLALLHDENENGKTEVFKEGYGFSNNAKSFLKAPSFKKAAFTASGPRTELAIKLRY